MRPKYKQDYDDFFKELNASIDEYQYFIKTDITNFFANINVDKLVAQIDKVFVIQMRFPFRKPTFIFSKSF